MHTISEQLKSHARAASLDVSSNPSFRKVIQQAIKDENKLSKENLPIHFGRIKLPSGRYVNGSANPFRAYIDHESQHDEKQKVLESISHPPQLLSGNRDYTAPTPKRVLISLDTRHMYSYDSKNHWNMSNTNKMCSTVGLERQDCKLKDYEITPVEKFNNFFQLYSTAIQEGKAVSVHCGAGHGRTGTMFASLVLKEFIDTQQEPPNETKNATVTVTHNLKRPKKITTYPLVKKAIEHVRKQYSIKAVETENDVNSLNHLFDALIETKKTSE